MNPLELLQKVKALVFEEQAPAEPVTTVEPLEYSLQDGTKVYIDKLEVGGMVTLEQSAPAPAGSHTLADGTVLELGEGGVISAITPVAVAPEEPAQEDMGKKYEEKFAAYDAKFSTLETENANLKAAFAKADEAIKGLVGLVERLVKEPTQEAAEPVKSGFRFGKETNKEDQLNSIINLFKQ
jgi:hypothetical protein